uniref:Methyltransferase domain-containing protein n=1 Tax=Sinocyclocheilus anshuiensis TaxID=1608454 RepID=A0A671S2U8_9TELE
MLFLHLPSISPCDDSCCSFAILIELFCHRPLSHVVCTLPGRVIHRITQAASTLFNTEYLYLSWGFFFLMYILHRKWKQRCFGFHSVQDLILPVLQSMSHSQSGPLNILDMGCGTSTLGPCIHIRTFETSGEARYFGARSLDLILDKGTDALVRSKEGQVKAGQIVKQCLQVLKPSGSLLQFSDEDPDARLLGELRGVSYFCYQISPCA